MVKPTKPTPPDRALRSNPSTFSANAEAWITYQWSEFPDYVDAVADFTDEQAENALAAALGGDLPPLTGKALQFLRVNAGETAAEFADVPTNDLTQLEVEDDTSTVFGQVSGQRLAQATVATLNAGGSAPVYACRAWVNFNGTGTVSIRASGNVSSITDQGVGYYTVNFATAMPDNNYSVSVDDYYISGAGTSAFCNAAILFPVSFQILTGFRDAGTFALVDRDEIFAAVFR